jgi:glycosyltransferase involved in cell wall biosynthesis
MRVVVLSTSFPRAEEDPSGHFVRASARRLVAEGHEVHVVAPGGSPFGPPEHRDGLWIHDAGGGSLFAWPGAAARLAEAPWRLVGAGVFGAGALARLGLIGRVDRAVAHWIVPCAFPLATVVRAPLEVVAHGADVRLLVRAPRDVRERVLGLLLDRDARFTFAASSMLASLERAVGPGLAGRLASRARVEPPAIVVPDVAEHAASLRASCALAPGAKLAVTACRLIATKRVELAVDAVRAAGAGFRLVIVGDGPERAALAERAADLASRGPRSTTERAEPRGGWVTFTGALPRREALAWVAAADVLLHPSAVEAAPTVVREARALGVPVIACDAGDIAAWARDDAGIRVVDATAKAFACALVASG